MQLYVGLMCIHLDDGGRGSGDVLGYKNLKLKLESKSTSLYLNGERFNLVCVRIPLCVGSESSIASNGISVSDCWQSKQHPAEKDAAPMSRGRSHLQHEVVTKARTSTLWLFH